jgi:hypothetical protein
MKEWWSGAGHSDDKSGTTETPLIEARAHYWVDTPLPSDISVVPYCKHPNASSCLAAETLRGVSATVVVGMDKKKEVTL